MPSPIEEAIDNSSEVIQEAVEQALHELELGEEPLSF